MTEQKNSWDFEMVDPTWVPHVPLTIDQIAKGTVIRYKHTGWDHNTIWRQLTVTRVTKREVDFIAWDGEKHTRKVNQFVSNVNSGRGEIVKQVSKL